jgi:glycosyltransferase involved in cell wall biosynthesis
MIKRWKSKPMIVGDPPPVIPHFADGYSCKLRLVSPSVVVINSYSNNEALEEIIDAAKSCTDVTFYVTGDKRKAGEKILSGLPKNVILTGWLNDNEFWWSLTKCNAILTLIQQENTILRGGWEAMYLGQPLITSNTIALRDYFHKGTVFVDNQGESISTGVMYTLKNEMILRANMEQLAQERILEWNEKTGIFIKLIPPYPDEPR